MPPKKMTEERFFRHCNESDGLCLNCGAIRYGMTEPDAEHYPCEECGEERVQGFENALIDGNIVFVMTEDEADKE